MNKIFKLAIGAVMALGAYTTPSLALDVGVSLNIGQPGYYGRIDVGDAPRPRIIYAQPVIIDRVRVQPEPVYLHVRPGHARRWKRHCHEYDACDQRVYFVNDNWYETVYVDHHRQRHSDGRGEGHGKSGRDNDNGRGEGHGNNGRGNDNGRGQGNGKHRD